MIEDLSLKHNLSILNDGSNTYLHPATGSSSAIDLSIASPSLYLDSLGRLLLTYMHPQLQMAPGSYLKPTGLSFLQKLLQIWVKIILTI